MCKTTSQIKSKNQRTFILYLISNICNLLLKVNASLVFTEYGLLMLASVLNSERAIQINIQIVRIFSRMRTMIESHKEILKKLEMLEKKDIELDDKVTLIFEYLKELEQTKQEESDFKQRKRIGFK